MNTAVAAVVVAAADSIAAVDVGEEEEEAHWSLSSTHEPIKE